ncbi:hypothetical protein J5X84_21435 [Streptosporangiaceae bacterium NEAU-GS5]|nr:hypothetical protein [Streptosporangiaceae bacterium NEAU-GS5]
MDLDEAADRLYGLAPGEFVAARDALAKQAKDEGDAALAKDVRALRRPTVVAWAVNQASRAYAEELGELLDLGERLRQAWQDQDAGALAELGRERHTLIGRLARRVREHAEAEGQSLSGTAATEVEQSLDAAVVDPDAADLVRLGRLTTALSYSGFTPAPAPARPRATPSRKPQDRAVQQEERDKRAEREREARAEAAAAAERAAEEAERRHEEWAGELDQAVHEHDRLSERVDQLTEELAAAKAEAAKAATRMNLARKEESRSRESAVKARRKADQERAKA